MRKIIIVLFLCLFNLGLFGDSNRYQTYKMMIRDLKNVTTFGYRELSQSLSYAINTVGISYFIGDENCFKIWGKGFFKVYDKQRKRYLYTRYGFFERGKSGLVTAEGYVLVTKMKITVKKLASITFEDMLYQTCTNNGTIIDRASFLERPIIFDKNIKIDIVSSWKMPVFFEGKNFKMDLASFHKVPVVFKDKMNKMEMKKINTSEVIRCDLFLPKTESDFKLTENKRYFRFKNCRVIKNAEVCNYQLEVSTVRAVHILPKVIKILEEKLKHNVKNKKSILAKIRIFKRVLLQYKKYIDMNQKKEIKDYLPQLKIYWPFLDRLD